MTRSRNFAFVGLGLVAGLALAGALGWAAAGSPPLGAWSGMGGMHGTGNMGGGSGMQGHHSGSGCHMCGGESGSAAPAPGNRTVAMRDSAFAPATLTIRVGETVTWVNRDGFVHTVTSDSGRELASGDVRGGASWSHAFTRAGTYEYHCEPHSAKGADGAYRGMVGTIVVKA